MKLHTGRNQQGNKRKLLKIRIRAPNENEKRPGKDIDSKAEEKAQFLVHWNDESYKESERCYISVQFDVI